MSTPRVTIQAKVNTCLLTKASRLFTGTLPGRIIEIVQNARRAGAKHIHTTGATTPAPPAGGEVKS